MIRFKRLNSGINNLLLNIFNQNGNYGLNNSSYSFPFDYNDSLNNFNITIKHIEIIFTLFKLILNPIDSDLFELKALV